MYAYLDQSLIRKSGYRGYHVMLLKSNSTTLGETLFKSLGLSAMAKPRKQHEIYTGICKQLIAPFIYFALGKKFAFPFII